MRNRVLVVVGIAFVAYILGSRANRAPKAKPTESARQQAERLLRDPKLKKARQKKAKKLQKKLAG